MTRGVLTKPNEIINIETTNICSARCIICPRESFTPKPQIMSMRLFKKIIDDASRHDIRSFDTCGFGDPFTDKLFLKRCAYVRKKMPNAKIYASSTCYLMKPELYDKVIKYIDILKISSYGMTENIYEAVHRGNLKFNQSMSNILGLLERMRGLKKKPYTIGLFVVVDENEHQKNAWVKFWESKLDEVFVWLPHNWVDYRNYRTVDHGKQVSCGRPLNGPLYVAADGTVSPCCWDINKRLVIGDMNRQTIEEILNSKKYLSIKKAHEHNDFKGLICYHCDQTNPRDDVLLYATNKNRKINVLTSDSSYVQA